MGHAHDAVAGHGHDAHGDHAGEHVSLATYAKVFWALMGLLVLTLAVAAFDLGIWNLPIAMVIAIAKAALVIAFFMHLKFNSKLVQVFGVIAFFWLIIMFVLTPMDYLSRHMLHPGPH